MARTSKPRILLLAILLVVMKGTAIASANTFYTPPSPLPILVVALPVIGVAVLLISALPALLGRPYHREPAVFHMANIVAATSVITFLTVLVANGAFMPYVDTTVSLSVAGVLALLIITGVLVRYLLVPLQWAVVAGTCLALFIVSLAYVLAQLSDADSSWVFEVALRTLSLWLLIWLGLLLLETARYHYTEDETHEEPDRPGVPMRRRMLRLGELLILNMVLPAFVLLRWTS